MKCIFTAKKQLITAHDQFTYYDWVPVAYFTKKVNPNLAERPPNFYGKCPLDPHVTTVSLLINIVAKKKIFWRPIYFDDDRVTANMLGCLTPLNISIKLTGTLWLNSLTEVWCKISSLQCQPVVVNTLRPRQNGRHFAHNIFKSIFLNENVWISTEISLNFVPKGPINHIPALVQIMAWRRPGDKPLAEARMVIYRRIYASFSLNELNRVR